MLELLLYTSFFKLPNAMPDHYSLVLPPVEAVMREEWAQKVNFVKNDLGDHVGFAGNVDPELFYCFKDEEK